MKPIVLIPARMKSSRLPGKPLVEINGKPLIQVVYEEAVKTGYFVEEDFKEKEINHQYG